MKAKKNARTWRNSALVEPRIHIYVALFITAVVVLTVVLSCWLFHLYFQHILSTLAASNNLTEETTRIVDELFFDLMWVIGIVEVTILFAVVLLSLNYVFKLTGAEYALCRHVREKMLAGNWEEVRLRKGDALVPLSEELNKLSEQQAAREDGAP